MAIALTAAALILILPLALALGSREQGRDVLQQILRAVHEIPALVRDGAARVCREAWSRFRETLRLSGIRESWVQQTVGALVFAPAALIGIWALVINLVSTLAGTQGTVIPLIETLTELGVGPVMLMGLEMGLACLLFPALALDLMGITNISYFYSPENISNKWLRYGLLASFVAGTAVAGYLLYQSGILRGAVVQGTSTSTDLIQASGLESESGSSTAAQSASGSGGAPEEAVHALMTGPSILGYIAGAVALVFVIPAAALVTATPLFLAVSIPAGIVWTVARLLTGFMNAIYNLMLSLFNYALRLRGEEPVERPGEPNQPGDPNTHEDSGGDPDTNGQASSSEAPSDWDASGRSSTDGTTPTNRSNGRAEHGQNENGQSGDPAGDAAETNPLYEDDENWNPIA